MKPIILLFFMLVSTALFGQSIGITGIDATNILKSQRVDLYVTQTDDKGNPIKGTESLSLYESPDGSHWKRINDWEMDEDANRRDGISFMLLIDNSGSMYDDLKGQSTEVKSEQRMTHAKSAISSFLDSIEDSRDRIALVSFNTDYTTLVESTKSINILAERLEKIEKPESDKAYTELYASLERSAHFYEGNKSRARKILVVLSDGENYPFYLYNGEPHSEYGTTLFTPEEAVRSLNKAGITLFAIHFGIEQDPYLGRIAHETGGKVFDASNASELSQVYRSIRENVINEYRIRYKAGVYGTDRVYVKIGVGAIESQPRYYYNAALFGQRIIFPLWGLLILFLLSLLLWIILTRMRLEHNRRSPHIELIGAGGLRNKILELNNGRTLIGNSEDHDLTLPGLTTLEKKEAATIVYDEEKQSFTLLAGEGEVTMVNNKEVKTKNLQAGDVIKVGDNLIIFDDEGTQIDNG